MTIYTVCEWSPGLSLSQAGTHSPELQAFRVPAWVHGGALQQLHKPYSLLLWASILCVMKWGVSWSWFYSSLSFLDRAKIIVPLLYSSSPGSTGACSTGCKQHSRNLNSDLSFGPWNAGIPHTPVSSLFFVVLDGIWVFLKICVV